MPETNNIQPTGDHPYSKPPAVAVGRVRDYRPRGFKWVKVAQAISEGKTNVEAAAIAEVSPAAIWHWRRHPKFIQLLGRYQERVERESAATGAALRSARMRKINRHVARIEKVFDERAEQLKDLVAGGSSGLIAHDQKSIGSGPNAEIVDVYEFDAALSREYRGVLEQAAKEIGGQYDEGAAGSNPHGQRVNISINFPVMSAEQLEAVNQAPVIDLPPMARRLLSRPSDGQQQ